MLHKQPFYLGCPTQVLGKAWRKGGHTGSQDPLILTSPSGDNPLFRWGLFSKGLCSKASECVSLTNSRGSIWELVRNAGSQALQRTCVLPRSSGDSQARQSWEALLELTFSGLIPKDLAPQNTLIMALGTYSGSNGGPPPKYVHTLIPKTCERDLIIWKNGSLQM